MKTEQKNTTDRMMVKYKRCCRKVNMCAWTLEIKIPKRPFVGYSEKKWGFIFRRLQTRVGSAAYWNLPFVHDPRYFGILEFE